MIGEYGGYRVEARDESSGEWIIRWCFYSEEWVIESREWVIERRFSTPGPGWHQQTLQEARRYASYASRDGLDRRVIVAWGFEGESGEGLESLWRRGVEASWEEQQRAIEAARKEAARNRELSKHFRAAVRQSLRQETLVALPNGGAVQATPDGGRVTIRVWPRGADPKTDRPAQEWTE